MKKVLEIKPIQPDQEPLPRPSPWKAEWTEQAQRFWQRYQEKADLSDRKGQTAGIHPVTGQVWIGASPIDVLHQRDAAGVDHPLYLVMVGHDSLERKG